MFLTGGFESVLRGIAIVLCNWIYGLIPNLFSIFYYLADSRFINSEIIKTFSTNIYVLISVVMLFAFAVKLLQAIVNPDMLADSKKGVAGVAKRVFIALTLVILIPFAFDQLYELQHQVVSNSLIEKLLVGMQNESGDNNVGESSNAGQVLAAMTISGLLYPEDGATTTSENLQTNYNSMINSNIEDMSLLIPNINETYVDSNGNEKYVLNFNSLIALIAGVFVVYMLILFCFDTALRFIKLGFLELTAPISIMAYIYNGTEFLNKWFKETLNTFVTLFVRIAALSLLIYGMHILPQFMENFKDVKGKFWIQLFIIVGLLTFAKAAPDLIKTITGVTMKGGGINGRLGEMAAVGSIAQKAWQSVRNPAAAAAGAISMVGGAASNAFSTVKTSAVNGKKKYDRLVKAGYGKGLAGLAAISGGVAQGVGGLAFGTPVAAIRSLRNGVKNKNLHSIKDEYDRYKDSHKDGSNVLGRTWDSVREGVGFESRANAHQALNEELTKAQESLSKIRSSADSFLQKENSTRVVLTSPNGVQMNTQQAREYIETIRNSAPQRKENESDASFKSRFDIHMKLVQDLEQEFQDNYHKEVAKIVSETVNGTLTGEGSKEVMYEINKDLTDMRTATKKAKIDVKITNGDLSSEDLVRKNLFDDEYFDQQYNTGTDGASNIIAEAVTERNATKKPNGEFTTYGQQKADQSSRDGRKNSRASGGSGSSDNKK